MSLQPIQTEICCGSLEDARNAMRAEADRIELNSALPLGGLTPSVSMLDQIKAEISLPVICMVRVREGGFFYNKEEKEQMFADAKVLLDHGADGIAFGFLDEAGHPDWPAILRMVELVHQYKKKAVFHRAFDVCGDPLNSALLLERAGIDRLLTSGQAKIAPEGVKVLKALCDILEGTMEVCAGCGIHAQNAEKVILEGNVGSVHASCSEIAEDFASSRGEVSFDPYPKGRSRGSMQKMKELVKAVENTRERLGKPDQ